MDGRDFYFSNEYPLVRFLEKNGYDVSYISGVDTDRNGAQLLNHKVFLSVGHDEYWSGAQRANVEAARDAGVNLQFLSGNEVYWRTRMEPSPVDGAAGRTITSYKETWANGKIDPSTEWTGTWRDPRYAAQANGGGLPENASDRDDVHVQLTPTCPSRSAQPRAKSRLWRNTSLATLAAGSSAELAPHTVGYESNEDLDNGFRPAGLIRLSTTTGPTPQYLQDFGNTVQPGTTTHNTTMYRAASGALVFSAGTVQWTWGLDQEHDGDGAPADPRMQQAQINLLADMGAQPATRDAALSPASASSDTAGPTVTIIRPGRRSHRSARNVRHGVRNGQRRRRHRGRRRSLHRRRNHLAPGPGQAELDLHLHPEGPRHGQHQGARRRRQRQHRRTLHPSASSSPDRTPSSASRCRTCRIPRTAGPTSWA